MHPRPMNRKEAVYLTSICTCPSYMINHSIDLIYLRKYIRSMVIVYLMNNIFLSFIYPEKLSVSFARSSGPGGQNVNKCKLCHYPCFLLL